MKVDVAMCTWNSKKPWLRRCLASIKREVTSCHLIVVDRFSDNDTVEVIKWFFPEALIIESEANLGKARQEAIRHVDTDWFVFVDDDIELCDGWFKTIVSCLTYDIGAIAGLALPTLKWLEKLSLYNNALELQRVMPAIYLSNTLMRTKLVRDWSPPSFLCSGEDVHLSRHITNKGYTMMQLNELHVKHHGEWGLSNAKKDLWHYSGARLLRYAHATTKAFVTEIFTSSLNGLFASVRLKEPFIIPYTFLSEFNYLKGWLQWDKYRVLKR